MTAQTLSFKDLEKKISRYYAAGLTREAEELEFERDQRRTSARDRWAEEAQDKREAQSDRRKYGGFYGRA